MNNEEKLVGLLENLFNPINNKDYGLYWNVINNKKEPLANATELLNINDPEKNYTINVKVDKIVAPVKKGKQIGVAEILDNEGNIITKVGITVKENVQKANLWDYFKRNLNISFSGKNIL